MLSRPEVARPRPQVLRPKPRPGVTRPRHAGHKAKAKALSIKAKTRLGGYVIVFISFDFPFFISL